MEAAFSNEHLITLAGSMIPADSKFSYLSVAALYPMLVSFWSKTCSKLWASCQARPTDISEVLQQTHKERHRLEHEVLLPLSHFYPPFSPQFKSLHKFYLNIGYIHIYL